MSLSVPVNGDVEIFVDAEFQTSTLLVKYIQSYLGAQVYMLI